MNSFMNEDNELLQSVLESLSSDSDWTPRNVAYFMTRSREAQLNVKLLDDYIMYLQSRMKLVLTIVAIISTITNILVIIEFIRAATIPAEQLEQNTISLVILLSAAVLDTVMTGMLAYQKNEAWDDKLRISIYCRQEYQWLYDQIDGQLYRKSKYRRNSRDFMDFITHAKHRLAPLMSDAGLTPIAVTARLNSIPPGKNTTEKSGKNIGIMTLKNSDSDSEEASCRE